MHIQSRRAAGAGQHNCASENEKHASVDGPKFYIFKKQTCKIYSFGMERRRDTVIPRNEQYRDIPGCCIIALLTRKHWELRRLKMDYP